jgi:hypothetical protein
VIPVRTDQKAASSSGQQQIVREEFSAHCS